MVRFDANLTLTEASESPSWGMAQGVEIVRYRIGYTTGVKIALRFAVGDSWVGSDEVSSDFDRLRGRFVVLP